jgi:hypothetical protein
MTNNQNYTELCSLKELLEEEDLPIAWIVENVLPVGGFSIMIAKPKVGKSTLARQLALSVATGEDFLGMRVRQGNVLFISLEEIRGQIRGHFRSMGATGEESIDLYVGSTPKEPIARLREMIGRCHPSLIIIDTLFRFTRAKDVNDYAKTLDALSPLLDIARECSAHILCLHHAKKSEAEGADVILGSTAIFGSVDTAIVLQKSGDTRSIQTFQRYGTDLPKTNMHFDAETQRMSLGAMTGNETKERITNDIMKILKLEGSPLGRGVIEGFVRGRKEQIYAALKSLVDSKELERSGEGQKGDPYMYSVPWSRP